MFWRKKPEPSVAKKAIHSWKKMPDDMLGSSWSFVDNETGRLDDAEITLRRGIYRVYCRGACYGDFATFEQAVAQAEKYARG